MDDTLYHRGHERKMEARLAYSRVGGNAGLGTEALVMLYAGYFWPIAEGNTWTFRATTTSEIEMITTMETCDLHDGSFTLKITKSHPWTYWGPESRHEILDLYCQLDIDGIWMSGYSTIENG